MVCVQIIAREGSRIAASRAGSAARRGWFDQPGSVNIVCKQTTGEGAEAVFVAKNGESLRKWTHLSSETESIGLIRQRKAHRGQQDARRLG
jgi:hypothetical protein